MAHSSHKKVKKSLGLLLSIQNRLPIITSKEKYEEPKEEVAIIQMPETPQVPFSVIHGTTPEKNTISNGWPLIVSYRCAGSDPDERL